jgi:hypothetical protein
MPLCGVCGTLTVLPQEVKKRMSDLACNTLLLYILCYKFVSREKKNETPKITGITQEIAQRVDNILAVGEQGAAIRAGQVLRYNNRYASCPVSVKDAQYNDEQGLQRGYFSERRCQATY